MADDAKTTEDTEEVAEAQSGEEPQGTNWKAESRKWEQRAKENKRQLDDLQKVIDGFEAGKEETDAKERKASEQIEALKAENKRLKAEAERNGIVREVARETGVDPDVLSRMRGESREEIEADAKMLAASSKTRWPDVKDKGAQAAPRLSKEEILAEKNPQKQLRLIAENKDLFK